MNLLPPSPGWDGMHPLVVHFPIVLLLLAPAPLLFGLFIRRHARAFALISFVLLGLGTASAWVAVATGAAAGERAEHVERAARGSAAPAETVVEKHEEMAETVRNVFTALTVMLAALLFVPAWTRRPLAAGVDGTLGVIFLALYAGGTLLLVNTAHQGGRLVHEFGIHAPVAGVAGAPAATEDVAPRATRGGEERTGESDTRDVARDADGDRD